MRCDAWNVLVDARAGSSLPHVGMADRTGRLGLAQVQSALLCDHRPSTTNRAHMAQLWYPLAQTKYGIFEWSQHMIRRGINYFGSP